jgi:hypothetical protein
MIADAVATYLNDQEFSFSFTATSRPYPTLTIKDVDGIVVSVFLGPRTSERVTRAEWQTKYRCYVVVQRKLAADLATSQNQADELTQLVEAMEASVETQDAFAGHAFEGYDDSAERLPFNMEMLRDASVFAAVFGMVFSD